MGLGKAIIGVEMLKSVSPEIYWIPFSKVELGGMESDFRSSILDQDLKGVKAEPITWKCICDELVCDRIPSSPKAQTENA